MGDIMENDKFIVKTKKAYGETNVVSARLPIEIIRQLDKISAETGRTRNELILLCIEYALDRIEIEK